MYNIDECAQCGGIRVAKSTLCADCLAVCNLKSQRELLMKESGFEMEEVKLIVQLEDKKREVEVLKHRYKILWKVTQKVFSDYRKYLKLYNKDEEKINAINRHFR